MNLPPYIDYSQYSAWMRCPLYWYERYINQVQPNYQGQREDAMAVGSLVHAGIEHFTKHGVPAILAETIEEVNPTRECYELAAFLAQRYATTYPHENFPFTKCEQPLTFPLAGQATGLAKLDGFFYVGEPITIPTGPMGLPTELEPGLWGREYKTKAASIPVSVWEQRWAVDMQANFQLLALQEYAKTLSVEHPIARGIIVAAIEKPKLYVPMRGCRSCKAKFEMAAWLPAEAGYSCPACGNVQKLAAPSREAGYDEPGMYRTVVRRTQKQLEQAKFEITSVQAHMQLCVNNQMYYAPDKTACIDAYNKPCPYFAPHSADAPANADPNFVKFDALRYVGEVNV